MKRQTESALLIVAVFAAFWAYGIADTLVRELAKGVTYIDLAVIYFLGLISGFTLGLIVALNKQGVAQAK